MKETKNIFLKINLKYTFNSFVTGLCNLSAVQAAKAVVKAPALKYNPVYLYGHTGVGKTHLLHAVGNSLAAFHPNINIKYISCEMLTEALVQEIRDRDLNSFINLFNTLDFLMVDDLQYLDSKARTQEVLLDAINSFIGSGIQIILSSDCSPQKLPNLKLESFLKGSMIFINEPDSKTKLAILKNKITEKHVFIPKKLLSYIAGKGHNAFELEGILNRIIAISSFGKHPITSNIVDEACRPFIEHYKG